MKKILPVLLIALSLFALPVYAQVFDAPVEEVEQTLKAFLDFVGIGIPAEDAALNSIAILIAYSWAAVRYVLGHTYTLFFGQYLGLICIYGYMLVKTLMEYIFVFCSACERGLACIPCISIIPPFCNGFIALTNFCCEPLFLGCGHMLMELGESLLPLREYFPIPFESQ